jgi:16S rRNA (cytidine1402-2'-O)-methyltransferase
VGTLYIVATPIGNLEDVTLRALRVLRQASLIAAEDTRTTRKLLAHYDIHTPLTSYFEHNKLTRLDQVLAALEAGDVALVSEAGMPGLSDPGYELVRAAVTAGIPVVPVPGPSAITTALAVSGLPTDRFLSLGFLPRKPGERRALLTTVARLPYTLVAFEAPHRLLDSLADVEAVLGDRPMAIARELTKVFEEVWRGTVSGARAYFAAAGPRGEFTLVIGGGPPPSTGGRRGVETGETTWDEARVRAALAERRTAGESGKAAVKAVAELSGWPKRAVYRLWTEWEVSL